MHCFNSHTCHTICHLPGNTGKHPQLAQPMHTCAVISFAGWMTAASTWSAAGSAFSASALPAGRTAPAQARSPRHALPYSARVSWYASVSWEHKQAHQRLGTEQLAIHLLVQQIDEEWAPHALVTACINHLHHTQSYTAYPDLSSAAPATQAAAGRTVGDLLGGRHRALGHLLRAGLQRLLAQAARRIRRRLSRLARRAHRLLCPG